MLVELTCPSMTVAYLNKWVAERMSMCYCYPADGELYSVWRPGKLDSNASCGIWDIHIDL